MNLIRASGAINIPKNIEWYKKCENEGKLK